jgi:L-fuconolactonase
MTVIDAHQHFWSLAREDYGWLTPDLAALYRDFLPADLHPLLAREGVDKTIAIQAAETVAETEFLLALADAHPWIAGVVGWIDFEAADAVERLGRLARHHRLVGIRPMLQDLRDAEWILADTRRPVLAAMAERGLVLDALIRPRHLSVIQRLAERQDALTIVVDHAAKPAIDDGASFASWRAGIGALALRGNVHCKISGLLTEAPAGATAAALQPYVDVLLEAFGPGRLLWGSDWPVLLLAGDYGHWSSMTDELLASLAPADIANIRGGNAARVYGIR